MGIAMNPYHRTVGDFAAMFPLPEPESEPDPPDYTPPVWFGPPDDELGTCLPMSRVIGRSDNAAIALRSIVAFSTGVSLDLVAVARGLSNAKMATMFHGLHGFDSEAEIADSFLRIGLRYADGTRVSNTSGRRSRHGESEPEGPVLFPHQSGGSQTGGGNVSMSATHWLWPLPPLAPLELFVEWPAFDIGLTGTQLDGHAIAQAAATSPSLWP